MKLSTESEVLPEQQNTLVHRLRMRLVELCQEHKHWVCNGRGYLEREGNTWICKDSKTGEELTIFFRNQKFRIHIDVSNDNNNTLLRFETEASGDLFFRLMNLDGTISDIFHGGKIKLSPARLLLSDISAGSVRLVPIDDERRWKYRQRHGNRGPENEVILGAKKEDDLPIYPHIITLMSKEGFAFSYGDGGEDFSFTEGENRIIWYPDFSAIHQKNILKRHRKEYVEVNCVCLGEENRPNQLRQHLLSRSDETAKFTKHYLVCGKERISVSHLIGNTTAEIIFKNQRWRVKLRENGELATKHDRYFEVSSPSTFWYDLRTHQKLDHEPS